MIGADNQALEILVANRSSLFAGVPIVFRSVDDYSPDMLKGQRDITGVTGDLDLEGTISLARRLHPGMNHLLVFGQPPAGGGERRLREAGQASILVPVDH